MGAFEAFQCHAMLICSCFLQALNERLYSMEGMVTAAEAREDKLAEKMATKVRELVTLRLAEHKRYLAISEELVAAQDSCSQLTKQLTAEKAVVAQLLSEQEAHAKTAEQLSLEIAGHAEVRRELLMQKDSYTDLSGELQHERQAIIELSMKLANLQSECKDAESAQLCVTPSTC